MKRFELREYRDWVWKLSDGGDKNVIATIKLSTPGDREILDMFKVLLPLANESERWKQIAMDYSDSLEAAEAFIKSKGLTTEWYDYDHEKTKV